MTSAIKIAPPNLILTNDRGQEETLPLSQAAKFLSSHATQKRFSWKNSALIVDFFSPYSLTVEVDKEGLVTPWIQGKKARFPLTECDAIFSGAPSLFIHKQMLHRLNADTYWLKKFEDGPLYLSKQELKECMEDFEIEDVHQREEVVIPILELTDSTGAFANLSFEGEDKKQERALAKELMESGYIAKVVGNSHYYCPMDRVIETLAFLLELGWMVRDAEGREVHMALKRRLQFKQDGDRIRLQGSFAFREKEVSIAKAAETVKQGKRFVLLDAQTVGLVDPQSLGSLEEGEVVGDVLEWPKVQLGSLLPALNEADCDVSMQELIAGIHSGGQVEHRPPGPLFSGQLYPYQQKGLDWLSFLYEKNFHGLLADEMGLGKSVQVLAFFSHLTFEKPALIVAPTSLMHHWAREIERFLPSLLPKIHIGQARTSDHEALGSEKLIITSYAILRRDWELFSHLHLSVLVLDEANAIKTAKSQTARVACSLKSDFRLALTGTPIENRIEELSSIFHFLIPGLVHEKEPLGRIKQKIRPFLLRRTKDEVGQDLPPKVEQTLLIDMEDDQAHLYESYLKHSKSGIIEKAKQEGASRYAMQILEAILRLRQIAAHPALLGEEASSTKFDRLLSDVEEIRESGHKVLIFSQFTSMLDLIEEGLKRQKTNYVRLDGKTKNREEVIDRFQNDTATTAFLLSLKAGGVGLNLTAADYVLIFEPWWNEAVENQAIDRAHRLGRTQRVIAKRYLAASTIEQKIMTLKEKKRALVAELLADQKDFGSLDLEALLNLF